MFIDGIASLNHLVTTCYSAICGNWKLSYLLGLTIQDPRLTLKKPTSISKWVRESCYWKPIRHEEG